MYWNKPKKRSTKKYERALKNYYKALFEFTFGNNTYGIPNRKNTRKRFLKATTTWTLINQNFRCRNCNSPLDFPEFDHINDDRSNNLYWNCQALCPNCHAKKTRKRSV